MQGGKSKPLISAFEKGTRALGWCRGNRPWLGENSEPCRDAESSPALNRLLIRSASNTYFPQVLSTISIPDEDEKLQAAVGKRHERAPSSFLASDLPHHLRTEENPPRSVQRRGDRLRSRKKPCLPGGRGRRCRIGKWSCTRASSCGANGILDQKRSFQESGT